MSAVFDYPGLLADADSLVKYFGMQAALVRNGVYRTCWVVITDYMPKDAASQLANPTDRRVIMSAGLGAIPGTPPNNELDQLVTYVQPPGTPPVVDEVLPFTCPVKPIRPAGIVVLYEFTVRR